MRFSTFSLCFLPALVLGHSSITEAEVGVSGTGNDEAMLFFPSSEAQPTSPAIYHNVVAAHNPSPTHSSMEAYLHDLKIRQAVGAAGGSEPGTVATQMSPVTTYLIHGVNGQETPVPYTQVFNKVPDQWPAPTAGTIGLGTIQGVIGVVKTNTKRSVWATAEALVERGLAVRRSNDGSGRSSEGSVWKVVACLLGVAGIMGVL